VTDEPTPTASAATIDADPSLDGSFDLGARIALGSVLARLLGGSHSTRLGRYEVIETVGQGACGQVYRARDGQLDRDVAIKVLLPGRFLDADGAEPRPARWRDCGTRTSSRSSTSASPRSAATPTAPRSMACTW
jgi:hypothetical protein